MSKNLTRKGYALGALVALASSVFAGSPALAADTMVLGGNYTTDTTLATVVTGTFTLNASLAPGSNAANISQLKYKVTNNGALDVVATPNNSGTAATVTSADVYRYATGGSATATTTNTLALSLSAAAADSKTQTVTVTAFLDADNQGDLDSTETQATVTVTFVKTSEVTTAITVTAPTEGDKTVTALVKYTNINAEALTAGDAGAYFTLGTGTAFSGTGFTATSDDTIRGVAYSATKGGFSYTTTGTINGTDGLTKGTAVKVQAIFKETGSPAGTDTIGSAQTASVVARAVATFEGNTVKSVTAAEGTLGATASADVALNTEKQVYFIAKDAATTPAAVAGVAVSVTVATDQTLSSTVTLTVNGTTYTSNAALPGATGVAKLAATTGADGKVTVTYKSAGFTAGKAVVVTAAAENFTAAVTATEATRNYSGYIENHEGNVANTTDGAAVKVNVVLQDQFGGKPANGLFTVTASLVGTSTQATKPADSDSNTYVAVVDGKANLSILDNGTGKGVNVYKISRWDVATNGVLTGESQIGSNFTINIVDAADLVVGKVALTTNATESATTKGKYTVASGAGSDTGASAAPLTYSTFSSVDLRGVVGTAPSTKAFDGTTVNAGVDFNGTVSSAATSTYGGANIPGATVTVSGTNLLFKINQDGADIYGDGSLTFVSKNDGTLGTVSVWSHLAGEQTVTIKSGSASATYTIVFADAAAIAATTVTAVVADGAAQFQAGRALDVAFKVTDKFGNPVVTAAAGSLGSLKIAQTGAGYLKDTGVVTTSATGAYTTKLITNFGDLGTSTITATLDLTTDVVRTVSSEFGVTDADVTVGGRAVYASAEFAKGKTVTVSVDGKRLYSKLFTTDAYTELKFTQKKAGKHTVTVRISGGVVYSEVVTTTK